MPEKTAAQKKAQQKYMEKFVRVEIRMEAEKRAIIQAHAEARGESVNGFINRAIDNQMAQDGHKGPCEVTQATSEAGAVSLPSEPERAEETASNAVTAKEE